MAKGMNIQISIEDLPWSRRQAGLLSTFTDVNLLPILKGEILRQAL